MSDRLVSMKTVIQVVGILVIATVAGLGYNSARGEGKVELDRQYFRGKLAPDKPVTPPVKDASPSTGTNPTTSAKDPVAQDPPETGNPEAPVSPEGPEVTQVQPADPVEEVFPDGLQRMSAIDCHALVGEEIVVFVDARKREDYVEAHIPGAVHLSHYESTSQIENVRPVLEQAFMIIVYCNGGDCEDSINLALDLTTVYGFSNDSVYVFEGGMEEWQENGFAVVKGESRD